MLHMTPSGPIYRAFPVLGGSTALEFDGINDILSRSDSPLFQLRSLTIEAFIRYDGGTSLDQIFFRGDFQAGRDPFYLALNNGRLRFNISDAITDRAIEAPNVLSTGTIHHVAATLNDATDEMKIFLDGTEVATGLAGGRRPDVALAASARVSIGGLADGFNVGQHFNGVIDEVRISDEALLPSQFSNATVLSNATVPEPSSMIAWCSLGIMGLAGRRRRRRGKVVH